MDNSGVGFSAEELAYIRQWRIIRRSGRALLEGESARLGVTVEELRRRLVAHTAVVVQHVETGKIKIVLVE